MEDGTGTFELPGDALRFCDVTSLLTDAAADMEPDSMMFMEGFTLQDAMCALEIGEPRLDSGLVLEEERRPPFDPLTPLLPEELCWILDRSFSYETEFHAGNLLSHTVFTFLYVHHLPDIEPDLLPSTSWRDPLRPRELVTLVLRSAVQGLLKSCDLSWRELSKGGMQDTEDWQSDKCEISLLSGLPVNFVLSLLEEASTWLSNHFQVSPWNAPLRARILLRKTILQIMHSDVCKDPAQYHRLVQVARQHLDYAEGHPSPEFEEGSKPHLAFDPYIGRRLNTFIPMRLIPAPSVKQTWETIRRLLDGWQELSLLAQCHSISIWETVGHLRLWLSNPPLQTPYIRSLTQSTFYDGLLVLSKYSFHWLIDRFFFESVGVTFSSITDSINEEWRGKTPPPLQKVERCFYKLITPHIRALWFNPPRQRRHLMKSLVDWHVLYDSMLEVTDEIDIDALPQNHILTKLPYVALCWRLASLREVVLSGFQLELYVPEERPFAYWYATQMLDVHLTCIDNLFAVVPKESNAYRELTYQSQLLTALQSMTAASFMVSIPLMSFEWERMRPNFYRRYKWAFRPEYENINAPVVAQPALHEFMQACAEILEGEERTSPAESIQFALVILSELLRSQSFGGWASYWEKERTQFVRNLADACANLSGLPGSTKELDSFNAKTLKWDPQVHPWFPVLSQTSASDSKPNDVDEIP